MSTDNTVFSSGMAKLPGNIAHAALGAGLPASSVTQFVGGLAGQNTTLLMSTPGVTPAIIGAGAGALLETYSKSFRSVWITAIPFVALAALGMSFSPALLCTFTDYNQVLCSLSILRRSSTITLMHLSRRMRTCIHFKTRLLVSPVTKYSNLF
jgi:hypothetical protein